MAELLTRAQMRAVYNIVSDAVFASEWSVKP